MRIIIAFILFSISLSVSANCSDSLKKLLNAKNRVDKFHVLLDLSWCDEIDLEERNDYAIQAYELIINSKNNNQKLEIVKSLANIYLSMGNQPEAKRYNLEMGNLAEQLGDAHTEGIANNSLGLIFQKNGLFDSALICYQKAINKFNIAKSEDNKAQAMVNVGIVYKNIGFYQDAVEITLEAIKLIETKSDINTLASAYNSIGVTLKELKNYKEAEFYLNKALKIRTEQNDIAAESGVLNNLGNVYRHWGKYDEALLTYKKALTLKEQLGDKVLIASTIDNIGEVYISIGDIQQSEAFFRKALQLRNEANYTSGIITSYNRLAKFFIEKSVFDSAIVFATKALKITHNSNSRKERLESYRVLKLANENQGNITAAILFANKYIALYDSLFSEEKAQAIANIEVKYRTVQFQKELALSIEKENAQQVEIRNQYLLIAILAVAFLSILIITFLVYKNYKVKRKAEEIEKMLRKEIQHRVKNNLQLISNMLHLQMEQATNFEIKKVLLENENRVQAINLVHQSLYRGGAKHDLDFRRYVANLIVNLKESYSGLNTGITEKINMSHHLLPTETANSLGLIVNELLTNAFKYSFGKFEMAEITITLLKKNNNFIFTLSHTSEYWDYDALRRKEGSLGLTLMEILVEQLDGKIEVGVNNEETKYDIYFPST